MDTGSTFQFIEKKIEKKHSVFTMPHLIVSVIAVYINSDHSGIVKNPVPFPRRGRVNGNNL